MRTTGAVGNFGQQGQVGQFGQNGGLGVMGQFGNQGAQFGLGLSALGARPQRGQAVGQVFGQPGQ